MPVCSWNDGGFEDGVAFVLRLVLFGPLPMAAVCFALRGLDKSQWSSVWGGFFKAGFVFHLSALAFSCLLSVISTSLPFVMWDGPVASGFLAANVVCSAFAVRWWRGLSAAVVPERFLSVTG